MRGQAQPLPPRPGNTGTEPRAGSVLTKQIHARRLALATPEPNLVQDTRARRAARGCHLALATPEPNLVQRRPGLQATFAMRADSIPRSAGPSVAGSVQGPVGRGRPPSRPGRRIHPSPSRSRQSCHRRPGGRIAEQPPLALPTSDPTRLVPVRRTVAVSRTRDPKRSLAPIPRPFGKHRGHARRRSHCARRLFWRLGDWPSRLAEGERTPTRPSGVVTGNVRHGDRRNKVRAGATGVGRRVQRSRQVLGGRGQRAKRRRREGRHRPDAANPGGCAVSLNRDDIAEGSSRRRARRSLAADIAISGLTPSDRP